MLDYGTSIQPVSLPAAELISAQSAASRGTSRRSQSFASASSTTCPTAPWCRRSASSGA